MKISTLIATTLTIASALTTSVSAQSLPQPDFNIDPGDSDRMLVEMYEERALSCTNAAVAWQGRMESDKKVSIGLSVAEASVEESNEFYYEALSTEFDCLRGKFEEVDSFEISEELKTELKLKIMARQKEIIQKKQAL
jgi:hypothetical protein